MCRVQSAEECRVMQSEEYRSTAVAFLTSSAQCTVGGAVH